MPRINILSAAVVIATTNEVAVIDTAAYTHLGLSVKNSGANSLDAFEVWGKFSDEALAPPVLLLNADANFTTPVYPVVKAAATPSYVGLPAAGVVWMDLNVQAFAQIIIKASSVTGNTTLDFYGNVK